MTSAPRVSIVVVTYNGLEDTRKCLRSLAALRYPAVETIVVDNASDDRTVEAMQHEFPACTLLRNTANVGFTGGNNTGIVAALERRADWIVLLNNDTTVRPEFIDRMVGAADAHPEFGIIGPIVNYMEEPEKRMLDGFLFNAPRYAGFFQPAAVPSGETEPPIVREVDVVDGCCMMIAAPVFQRIGLLDERFFIYHEVVDFCLRARRAGIRSATLGEQLVWHKGTSTFRRAGKRLPRYYDARNLLLVFRTHAGARHRGRTALGSAAMYLRYAYWRYCVEREAGCPDAAEAVLEGLWDGLIGRYGRFARRRRPAVPALRWLFEMARAWPRGADAS